MPRPNSQLRSDRQPDLLSSPSAKRSGGNAPYVESAHDAPKLRLLEAEVEHLRDELAQARGSAPPTGTMYPLSLLPARASGSNGVLWAALGFCAVALLFAILAVLYHG